MSPSIRSVALTLCLLSSIAVPGRAQDKDAKAKASVEAAFTHLIGEATRLNADALTTALAPDAQFIFGSMAFDREAFRAAAAAAFKGLKQHDVKVRQGKVTLLSPTAAMYTGTGTYSDRDTSGAASSGAVAWTVIYRMDKGTWRVITMHEAITPDAAVAQAGAGASREAMYQSLETAKFDAVPDAPAIRNAQLYGDPNTDAPHAEFTRFVPGADMGRHSHTNTVTIVVLRGAYLYRDEAGEKRVAAGDWLRIPGGKVHWSGGDKIEGATFYVHMDAKMDGKPVQ